MPASLFDLFKLKRPSVPIETPASRALSLRIGHCPAIPAPAAHIAIWNRKATQAGRPTPSNHMIWPPTNWTISRATTLQRFARVRHP